MLSKKMEKALNEQIKEELYSASIYLAISAWASSNDYNGTAHFFMLQTQEEVGHAMKIYNYLFEVEGKAVVPSLDQPPAKYKDLNDVFQSALKHEKYITGKIHDLVTLARDENDYATEYFLQWFVTEQVEEEASMNNVLAQLKMAGTDSRGLFLVDRELGKRQNTPEKSE
jgi:ferritin